MKTAPARPRRRCGAASCPHPTNNVGDFVVSSFEQIVLTDQRILDLAHKLEPFRARSRAQVAERADRLRVSVTPGQRFQ